MENCESIFQLQPRT